MIMVPELSIVELKVRDWKAAITWFHEIFGLPFDLCHHEEQYALMGERDSARLASKGTAEEVSGTRVLLQWDVVAISELVESLRNKGVKILKEVTTDTDEWYKRATIEGPEGLRMMLFEFDNYESIDIT